MTAFTYLAPDQKLELALQLRRRLTEATWIKGDYYCRATNGTICHCLIGAAAFMFIATHDGDPTDIVGNFETDAGEFIAAACPEFQSRGTPGCTSKIIDWNDNPLRTWAEVDRVVNRIVAHYEAELTRYQRSTKYGFV